MAKAQEQSSHALRRQSGEANILHSPVPPILWFLHFPRVQAVRELLRYEHACFQETVRQGTPEGSEPVGGAAGRQCEGRVENRQYVNILFVLRALWEVQKTTHSDFRAMVTKLNTEDCSC